MLWPYPCITNSILCPVEALRRLFLGMGHQHPRAPAFQKVGQGMAAPLVHKEVMDYWSRLGWSPPAFRDTPVGGEVLHWLSRSPRTTPGSCTRGIGHQLLIWGASSTTRRAFFSCLSCLRYMSLNRLGVGDPAHWELQPVPGLGVLPCSGISASSQQVTFLY
jgi:hypothetical protein